MKSKKGDLSVILGKLPMIVFIIVVTILILMLVYSINKGGLSFIASPPVKELPIP